MFIEHAQHLLLVYAAYLLAIASPGPSTMAIMGVAMNQGRPPAIALALGVVSGSLFWALLAATGISTILTAYAEALTAIKIAGGFYLLYLAWKSARSALTADPQPKKSFAYAKTSAYFRRGLLLHLSNPKAVFGWMAIMALGLRPDSPAYTLPAIFAGCAALGLTVNVGYAFLFSTALMGRAYRNSRRFVEGALAAIFGYAGLRLLLSKP